ncbi:heavy-metal-associated domain-containing protein, partial [Adlercreutzia sp. ZJ242]|uniref:heavy-metal-associated domain-containing protein n=1 Tax=Adlercreutzia sp. ZJ242 TaxID=2709409 RepID=UPI0013EBFA98
MERTIALAIDNMHCGKCVANVERHYRELPGVLDVSVDLEGKAGSVRYDDAQVGLDALLHALDDTNFKVVVMPEDGENPFLAEDAEKAEAAAEGAAPAGGEGADAAAGAPAAGAPA